MNYLLHLLGLWLIKTRIHLLLLRELLTIKLGIVNHLILLLFLKLSRLKVIVQRTTALRLQTTLLLGSYELLLLVLYLLLQLFLVDEV